MINKPTLGSSYMRHLAMTWITVFGQLGTANRLASCMYSPTMEQIAALQPFFVRKMAWMKKEDLPLSTPQSWPKLLRMELEK